MSARHVVGLEEAIEHGLPVARDDDALERLVSHVLEHERFEDGRDRIEYSRRGGASGSMLMKTNPPQSSHRTGCSPRSSSERGRELLGIELELDRPVEVVPPPVERADDDPTRPSTGSESGTAVPAGVVVRANRRSRLPYDEHGTVTDPVLHVAANAGSPLFLKLKKVNPIKLFKNVSEGLNIAFMAKSSGEFVMSVNIKCFEEKILKKDCSTTKFLFPLCTPLNMNSSSAFVATTVLFLMSYYGMDYSLMNKIGLLFISTFVVMGNSNNSNGNIYFNNKFFSESKYSDRNDGDYSSILCND